jgi:flagellum-specific peptidoglycan hydrolase FlgJ
VHPVRKPWWQQATALVTVTTGGMITGFNFVPGAAATMTSPTSVPLHLLALEQASRPGSAMNDKVVGGDSADSVTANAPLRSAIVNVAKYYLQLAATRTPAQLEALIWDNTSLNGADHGPSCAAFASLTLELAAQAVGQQSWVSGGTSYPWPLPAWADVRVDPNPASLDVTSMMTDAQNHGRWHPLGDGYLPEPGDWVLFDHHVEVVTGYSGGVLDSIGADSAPNLSVNAHSVSGSLSAAGVAGFIDNGNLAAASGAVVAAPPVATAPVKTAPVKTAPVKTAPVKTAPVKTAPIAGDAGRAGQALVPGLITPVGVPEISAATTQPAAVHDAVPAPVPAAKPTAKPTAEPAAAAPAPKPAAEPTAEPAQYRHYAAAAQAAPGTAAQQAFISLIAPGAEAAQQRWGVPAAVTVAQAIEESAWGKSQLAAEYHNLFGIKGNGPAGSVALPTSEDYSGQWVTIQAQFRVYHNVAESIGDHAELLATSGYYHRAMADRALPDAFANDLTGVYATDPDYGANLIAIMRLYNLYRFDSPATTSQPTAPAAAAAPVSAHSAAPVHSPAPTRSPAPVSAHPAAGRAGPADHMAPAGQARIPGLATPELAPTATTATAGAHPGALTGVAGSVIPGVVAQNVAAADHLPGGARIPGLGAPVAANYSAGGHNTAGYNTAGHNTAGHNTAGHNTVTHNTATHNTAGHATANYQRQPVAASARYQPQLPHAMTTAYFATAKGPLAHGEHLYRDVAGEMGISWKVLAACDWMQCKAHPRYSPVHGEKIGTLNSDGTSYPTKSAALAQCASDLVELAAAVYGIDLTARRALSVRALADSFAAFRWGALLRRHRVSAMEFPYAVAGLTAQHLKMHWPVIDDQAAPDRPGARFREPFGAVPVVLCLDYPATV